jgi:hypothetical protein
MLRTKKIAASVGAAAVLAVGMAGPAAAQPIIISQGLVNVTVTDVLNNNEVVVQVPVGVAANVCDVNAAVLIAAIEDTGSADCDATADSQATAGPGNRP